MALHLDITATDKGSPVIKKFSDTTKKQTREWVQEEVKAGVKYGQVQNKMRDDKGRFIKSGISGNTQLGKSTSDLGSKVQALHMGYLAIAASLGVVVVAFKKALNDTVNYRDEISKASKATGITTEALVGFNYAAEIGGASQESMTKGLRNMYRQMQGVKDGLAESKRMFDQLGISVLDTDGNMRDGEQVFIDIADKISKIKNPSEKAALSLELFGRSGMELVPMLNEGKEGLAKYRKEAELLGLTFDKKAGDEAEKFKDDMLRLQSATKGMIQSLIGDSGLVPALSSGAVTIAASIIWVREYGAALKNDMVPQVIKTILSFNILNPLIKYNAWVLGLFKKEVEKSNPELKTFDEIMAMLNAKVDAQIKLLSKDNDALDDNDKAIKDAEEAAKKFAEALSEIPEYQKVEIDMLIKSGQVSTVEDIKAFEEMEKLKSDTLWAQVEERKKARFEEFSNEAALIAMQQEAEQTFMDFVAEKRQENQDAILRQLDFEAEAADKAILLEEEKRAARQETLQMMSDTISGTLDAFGSLYGAMADMEYANLQDAIANTEEGSKERKKAAGEYKKTAQMETYISMFSSAQKAYEALAGIPFVGPALGVVAAAAALKAGQTRLKAIDKTKYALGGDFITTGPQTITVGDNPGGKERVQVTPISSPNVNGPGGDIYNINVYPQSLDENYVRTGLVPMLQNLKERGVRFA